MDFFDWLGQTLEAWLPVITLVSLFVSALVAFIALRRQDVREHHRWLQEKRREAYVQFLSATRRASATVTAAASTWKTTDEREAAINRDEDEVNSALDVLYIVGPQGMAAMGHQLVARLSLDRLFYSPARDQLLLDRKDEYIGLAEGAGPLMHSGFAALYKAEPFDVAAYELLHEDFPLRFFRRAFTREARSELAKAHPGLLARFRR